jgi:hypothetical protein
MSALFRRRLLAEPQRLGRFRAFAQEDLPGIRAALVAGGYITAPDAGQAGTQEVTA